MSERTRASLEIEARYKEVCAQSSIAQRAWDVAYSQGLSERDEHRMIVVAALEALDATTKRLEKALIEAPPDAIFVRDENGERRLMQYIGPTVKELREQRQDPPPRPSESPTVGQEK